MRSWGWDQGWRTTCSAADLASRPLPNPPIPARASQSFELIIASEGRDTHHLKDALGAKSGLAALFLSVFKINLGISAGKVVYVVSRLHLLQPLLAMLPFPVPGLS